MTAPTAGPVDYETASLLDLIAADRIHADDRATVTAAIIASASEHGSIVNPNHLRELLHNEHGCIVHPNVIGATVNALRRQGVLVEAGWVVTEGSTSGNNGRPARCYTYRPPADFPPAGQTEVGALSASLPRGLRAPSVT